MPYQVGPGCTAPAASDSTLRSSESSAFEKPPPAQLINQVLSGLDRRWSQKCAIADLLPRGHVRPREVGDVKVREKGLAKNNCNSQNGRRKETEWMAAVTSINSCCCVR